MYKSGLERSVAAQLVAAGVPFNYEGIKLDYTIGHVYKPDFVLVNGLIIETKGYFRRGDTAKMKAVRGQHPNLDIRFVFSDSDKPISGQKTTHAEWAERHGFRHAEGRIPDEWLK